MRSVKMTTIDRNIVAFKFDNGLVVSLLQDKGYFIGGSGVMRTKSVDLIVEYNGVRVIDQCYLLYNGSAATKLKKGNPFMFLGNVAKHLPGTCGLCEHNIPCSDCHLYWKYSLSDNITGMVYNCAPELVALILQHVSTITPEQVKGMEEAH